MSAYPAVVLQDGYDYLSRRRRTPFETAGKTYRWYPEGHFGSDRPPCELPAAVYQKLRVGGAHREEFGTLSAALEAAARAVVQAMRRGEIQAPAREEAPRRTKA